METTGLSREQVFDWLKSKGAVKAEVEFSGGGDEGGVEGIVLFDKDSGILAEVQETYSSVWENGELVKQEIDSDALFANALCEPVYSKYYGFAGEFHVDGKVVWNVTDRTVKMSGEESVESYEGFEETI